MTDYRRIVIRSNRRGWYARSGGRIIARGKTLGAVLYHLVIGEAI